MLADAFACALAERRTPRGRRRWYAIYAPGREQATCDKVRRLLSRDVLEDAFVMRKERWTKRGGQWSLRTVPMHQGYFFAVTRDVLLLERELSRLSFPVHLAGAEGRHLPSLSAQAQKWYEGALDGTHIMRASAGVMEDGALRVCSGPLAGQENRVFGVDRHKRLCQVTVDGALVERVALSVSFKD